MLDACDSITCLLPPLRVAARFIFSPTPPRTSSNVTIAFTVDPSTMDAKIEGFIPGKLVVVSGTKISRVAWEHRLRLEERYAEFMLNAPQWRNAVHVFALFIVWCNNTIIVVIIIHPSVYPSFVSLPGADVPAPPAADSGGEATDTALHHVRVGPPREACDDWTRR